MESPVTGIDKVLGRLDGCAECAQSSHNALKFIADETSLLIRLKYVELFWNERRYRQ